MIFFDCESHLIRPGMLFPKMVCLSYVSDDSHDVVKPVDGVELVLDHLRRGGELGGHSVAFDLGLVAAEEPRALEPIFKAYDDGAIHCTMIRAMLLDIASGVFQDDGSGKKRRLGYGLDDLVWRYQHRELPKADTWRLHYAYLQNIPIADWPPEAVAYALNDSIEGKGAFLAQAQIAAGEGAPGGVIPDATRQAAYAWALHLEAGWGIRTNAGRVAHLRDVLEAEQREAAKILVKAGIMRPNGSKDMGALRALIAADYKRRGAYPPTTPKGSISTSAEVLEETSDPALMALAESSNGAKILSTYVPALEGGIDQACTSSPNVLVASGRTSWRGGKASGGGNWQNPPRKGGVRECVEPRYGFVYVFVDYDTIELKALAQSCLDRFGYSEMAAALIRGEDLHVSFAADMLGLSYPDALQRYLDGDPQLDEARQAAKNCNFAFPGGVGIDTFLWLARDLIKAQKIANPVAWGNRLKGAWMAKWYEMKDHFADANRIANMDPPVTVQKWSGRVRGGLTYCSAANDFFQAPVADGAKLANYRLVREAFVGTGPFRGCRPVLFLHDEVGSEVPEWKLHDAAMSKTEIMRSAMQEVIPDIPITCAPVAVRRWYKGAKPVYIDGRLVPSMPVKDASGKVKWVADVEPEMRVAA